MDDLTYSMIVEAAGKIFAGRGGEPFSPALWSAVEDAGFPLALVDEARGGFGFSAREAFGSVRGAAAHAVALPLGETMLANWALSMAGMAPLEGTAGLAWSGVARAVSFGRHLDALVVLSEAEDGVGLCVLHPEAGEWRLGVNHADEPRDALSLAAWPAPHAHIALSADVLRAAMAMLRAVQMAAAVETVAEICLRYCGDREQFGRPLGRFQAIQHQLAVLATHGCAATTAADMAVALFETAATRPEAFVLSAAAAKLRAAEAATAAAAIAHQVHGAIGFSREYPLHPLTRRLWSWRDEDGSEAEWAAYLARWAQALPEGGLWKALTTCDLMNEAA